MPAPEYAGIVWRKSSYSGENGDCVEVGWRKSSYSGENGNCVEIGWRKSSYSGVYGNCLEVGRVVSGVAVRDSKQGDRARLEFGVAAWRAFLGQRVSS